MRPDPSAEKRDRWTLAPPTLRGYLNPRSSIASDPVKPSTAVCLPCRPPLAASARELGWTSHLPSCRRGALESAAGLTSKGTWRCARHRGQYRFPRRDQNRLWSGVVPDSPDINKQLASITALGRVGVPEDIGSAVATLLSGDNRWINAQRIGISRGQSPEVGPFSFRRGRSSNG